MEILESTVVKGLRPDIKAELRLMQPNGLGQIMQLAQLIEDCNSVIRGDREQLAPRANRGYTAQHVKTSDNFTTRTVSVGECPSIQKREFPSKLLSESEWQVRKAKGLCFKCDEKFTVGHQCKNREL